jgi:hypothetical protein
MEWPLSPVIANFFKEDFEKKVTHKPVCWYRYVDDTFVIWPHDQDKLLEFLNHLSRLYKKIQFTIETEKRQPPTIFGHRYIQENRRLAPLVTKYIKNPPILTSTSNRTHITILPKNNLSSHPWYTELKLSVTKTPFNKNLNSSPQFSRWMYTTNNKFDEPWNWQLRPPRMRINPPRPSTCHTHRLLIANSAEWWPSTT